MVSEFYKNLLKATDNTQDITNEKYATVTKIENNLCNVNEDDSSLEHENVPILNGLTIKTGDKVVLGFVANSIYNPIILGKVGKAELDSEQIVEKSGLNNLGLAANSTQHQINLKVNEKINQGGGSGVDIVTSWNSTPTDTSVPSEKLTKDTLDLKLNSSDAFSGDYDDLTNKPTIPSKITDLTNDSDFIEKSSTNGLVKNDGTVDTTQYLSSLPSHNHNNRYYTESEVDTALNGKQATLVSGTNIKTVNNQSLLGSGNISIQGGGSGASNIFDLDPTSQYGDTVVEEGVDRDGTGLGYGCNFLIYNSQEQKFYYDKNGNGNADNDNGNELATINDLPSVPTNSDIVDLIYPVGSIYMSVNSTSPSVLFGGTWTQLEDTFLLACGSTYASDGANVHTAQHGEASHKLTASESGQKNLGTVTSTGGNHTHKVGTAQYLTAPSGGNGVTRNSTAGQTGTKVSNLLKSDDGVTRYSPTSSGDLSVSTTISGSDATSSHNNMPPYMAVYMWKRTA